MTEQTGIRLTDKTLPVLFRQLKKHASKWREIGLHLGFLPGELSNIEARPRLFQGAPVSYLGSLLEESIQWAPGDRRGSTSFTTLESLKAALVDTGLAAAARDLKIETGSEVAEDEAKSSDISLPPSKRIRLDSPLSVDLCAEKLSRFYMDLRSASNTWPPLKLIDFVQLALVKQSERAQHIGLKTVRRDIDEVYGNKTSILFNDLFEGLNEGSLVLLEGRPGSGKTTLMLKIACDWKKIILKQAEIVILVQLRRLSQTGDIYLHDLLKASCNRLSDEEVQCVCSYVERRCGENVVFLFDGYDEYYSVMSKDNIVKKIATKEMFSKSVVVVSSRPAATVEFRKTAARYVEVVGFQKAQVFQYINSYYVEDKEKASSLIQHLEGHPNLLNICYLPLHCAMLVFLAQEDSTLPNTETEFYRLFTLAWMFRCSHKTGYVYPTSLESFDDISKEDKLQLDKVCYLAYYATLMSKQVFTAKEVKNLCSIQILSQSDSQCGLEMLAMDRVFILTGMKETYSFFHLTIQEFLAAYHLCTLNDHEKVIDIIKHNRDGDRLTVTLRFLCGMMDYSEPSSKAIFDSILEATSSNTNHLFHVQCSYEFQCPLPCTHVFNFHNGSFKFDNLIPSDSNSLVYFLTNASYDNLKIQLESCSFGVREYEAVLQAFGDHQVSLELQFSTMLPLMNAMSSVGVPRLVELRFRSCSVDDSKNMKAISGDSSSVVAPATNIPTEQCPELKKIAFRDCDVDDDIVKSLKCVCSKLESLTICGLYGECPLNDSTCQVLGETLQYCSRLQYLDLSQTAIDDSKITHVVRGIAGSKELKELNLSYNELSEEGAVHLAEGLTQLEKLDLVCNLHIGDAGLKVLIDALLVNCKHVKDINLDINGLTDDSVPYLIKYIKTSKALERLVLVDDLVMGDERDNRFTPRRWAELEEAVAPRTQDMSKLKLIGEPVLSDDESSEQQIQMAR